VIGSNHRRLSRRFTDRSLYGEFGALTCLFAVVLLVAAVAVPQMSHCQLPRFEERGSLSLTVQGGDAQTREPGSELNSHVERAWGR
jgi:hypothetical protein